MKKEKLTDSEEKIVRENVQNTHSAYLKYRNYGIVILPLLVFTGLIREYVFGGLSAEELISLMIIAFSLLFWIFEFRKGFLSIKYPNTSNHFTLSVPFCQ